MTQNATIVNPNASAIARPPGRGIGRGCVRRPPGMSSIPKRSARRPTSGVIAAERRNATTAELTRRRPVTRPNDSRRRRTEQNDGEASEVTRLGGRVAVITGGARGIGAETARVFREAGATVETWDVGEGADQRVDVTDGRAVEAAVAATVTELGGIDILGNNAGILRDGQLVKIKDGEVV